MKRSDYISPTFFLLISSFLIFSSLANPLSNLIDKLDVDQDGTISLKEAVAEPALLAVFGKIDTDGNGKLSSKELETTKVTIIDKPVST
ncbi:hypothetical protein L0668_01230 [Paraglaciecola aquimarina]|uniref:EF-hand domain-containing protein n=1 Tax=Paraglaciecola algarum TaxID=3050085 RepID=A0ABS9D267_9ALTE|nr:hypothetical protein [Paraglaciecola sp. G1-23]MCF2946714.1 hypothetical protein [Paraglaciecola sp. G1-23]